MNKKLALFGAGMLLAVASASAQQRVTGRVTDVQGAPVEGAVVHVPGTKIKTTTDAQGRFTLQGVPSSSKKISVSYLGMQTSTVSVAGNVQVVLKENELGEAVVVGYGTARKVGSVVGSVKRVDGDVVAAKPVTNVADALQGQVTGLQVLTNTGDVGTFGAVSMNIRGIGSLSASTAPLIVVDGSPAGTSILQMLGPNDIESVTVLKDASATSIYGSRAANGVIFVTTKRGRSGEKAQVTVSQTVGWSQIARKLGNPMSADELLDFQLENGVIYPEVYQAFKQHHANTNWQDYMFDNAAPMYQTDFNVRGGNERTNYYVSASYLNQQGVTPSSEMKRTTLRTNVESRVNSWMKLGVNQQIAYADNKANGYASTATSNLYSPANVATVWPAYWDPFDPGMMKEHKVWGTDSWGMLAEPMYLLKVQPRSTNNILYNGSAYVQLNPIKGLTIKSQLGLYATETLSNRKLVPSAAPLLSAPYGEASASLDRSSLWTITNTAEYKWTLATDHEFTVLLGHEGVKYDSHGFTATTEGLQDDRLTLLSNGTIPSASSESKSKYEYLSFFGRLDYGFKNKYFANFTVRSDESSRFGSKNRTALFYSGGVKWDVSMEEFMVGTRGWLSDLMVNVSVGSTGNSEVGNYTHLSLLGDTQYGGEQGLYYGQFPNTDLGWEKQIQTNVGLHARFIDRITADVNFYHRKTKDMLMSMPLPYTTGMSSMMCNIGEMSNLGVEIEVTGDVVKTRDWTVQLRANYTYNKNKIDRLFYNLDQWPNKDALISYIKGKSVNFYMPIFAGVDENDGAPMWYKVGYKGEAGYTYNPETMTKDASQIDNLYQDTGKGRFAPHFGGFGVFVAWKGLSLSADFTYVLGKYMVNNDYYLNTSSSVAMQGCNMDRDALTMWKRPGDHTMLPAFKYDSQFDTHLLENASFMRLKNLTLAYELPQKLMERTRFFNGIRLNFQARNLFTVTKFRGVDPEVSSNLTAGNYPATRQYVLGVDFSF